MRTYSFTIVLDEAEATETMANRLFEAGCDDGLFGCRHGIVVVTFERDGEKLEDVIGDAVRQIVVAGYRVRRAEIDDLFSLLSATA